MLDAGLYADVIVELKKNLNNEAWAQLFTTIAEPHPFPDEERRQREREANRRSADYYSTYFEDYDYSYESRY